MNEGVRITDFYRFDEVLGEGTFSTVYLAESRVEPDGWVAVKVSGGMRKVEMGSFKDSTSPRRSSRRGRPWEISGKTFRIKCLIR